MLNSWRGRVLLPVERVVQAAEGALERLGCTYRKDYGVSFGRRVEAFMVTLPLGFTMRVREAGLIFRSVDRRPDSAILISPTDSSPPFLPSFSLEFARRLPRPPWQRGEAGRRAAGRTWLKVFALSGILIGLGLFYFLFIPVAQLALLILIVNILGIAVPLVVILLTHPEVESRIQRWKWSRWLKGPELAALGWHDEHL